jgi:hypothetical protein
LSTITGLQTHVPASIHSILLEQQLHFSTVSYSVADMVASLEQISATGIAELVLQQLLLPLSTIAASSEEVVAGGM